MRSSVRRWSRVTNSTVPFSVPFLERSILVHSKGKILFRCKGTILETISRNRWNRVGIGVPARNAEEIARRKLTSPLKLEGPSEKEEVSSSKVVVWLLLGDNREKPLERRYCATICACAGEMGCLGALLSLGCKWNPRFLRIVAEDRINIPWERYFLGTIGWLGVRGSD